MSQFIPIDQMSKLRESAKNGDEKAVHILDMQLNDEDFSPCLNDYFNPHQDHAEPVEEPVQAEVESKEQDAMEKTEAMPDVVSKDNNIEQEEKDAFGMNILSSVYSLSSEIDKATMEIVQNDKISDSVRKGAIETLNDLKKQAIQAVSSLRSLKKDIEKKEEKQENLLQNPQNLVK